MKDPLCRFSGKKKKRKKRKRNFYKIGFILLCSVLTPTNLEISGEKKTKQNFLWNSFSQWLSLYVPPLVVVIMILPFSYKSLILTVHFYF